jgi:hypothetical protein
MFAITFTFNACGGDDDGGGDGAVAACKYTTYFYRPIKGKASGEICEEFSEKTLEYVSKEDDKGKNLSASEIKQVWKNYCEDEDGKFYDACPSGWVSKCSEEVGKTFYFYDNELKDIDCDDFSL